MLPAAAAARLHLAMLLLIMHMALFDPSQDARRFSSSDTATRVMFFLDDHVVFSKAEVNGGTHCRCVCPFFFRS